MTYAELVVIRRPRRRTHMAHTLTSERYATWCGLSVPSHDASSVVVPFNGGATPRLINDLRRELDESTCLRCTRLALVIVGMYATRPGMVSTW